jgi:hypothetical protein
VAMATPSLPSPRMLRRGPDPPSASRLWPSPPRRGQHCDMRFTSVTGHLMELDFGPSHRGWGSCAPLDLFGAPVEKKVPNERVPCVCHIDAIT